MKIVGLGLEVSAAQQKFWQTEVSSKNLQFASVNELDSDWKNGADLYLVNPELSPALLEQFERVPSEVRANSGFDALVHLQKQWWPRLYFKAALRFMIVKHSPLLNTQGVAYITGVGVQARVAASVLLEMGFSRIRIVWPEGEDAKKMIAAVRSNYFLTDIQWLGDEELTLQPNNGSILINTRDHSQNKTLVDDLSYLNFLQKDGLVVEFLETVGPNRILQEAQNIGQGSVRPLQLTGARDAYLWAEILQIREPESHSRFVIGWVESWEKYNTDQGPET